MAELSLDREGLEEGGGLVTEDLAHGAVGSGHEHTSSVRDVDEQGGGEEANVPRLWEISSEVAETIGFCIQGHSPDLVIWNSWRIVLLDQSCSHLR